jgi:hypothetical protein
MDSGVLDLANDRLLVHDQEVGLFRGRARRRRADARERTR